MICRFCGEDIEPDDMLHQLHCDGQQGAVDAALETTHVPRFRETSIATFYNAVDTGVIKTRREQAYAALRLLGISTANEVFEYLRRQPLGVRYDSTTRARFTELRDDGLIREVGERPCRITGQNCIVWEAVPSSEYLGPALIHRCETCGQIISRDVPTKGPVAPDQQTQGHG